MNQYILHLETATKACSVALSNKGSLVALKETVEDGYSHGENLNVFIEDVLKQANISIKDLNAVSVASGPGSYTGLRIGAATAKSLCYSLDIPLIAIDALTSLSEIAVLKHPNTNLCALIDARRMEVYNLFLNDKLETLKEITADIIDESSYEEFMPFVYFGDGAAKLEEVWSGRPCKIDLTIRSSAKGQVRLAYTKFEQKQFEDVAYWEPFYLKDFIAGKKAK
ncbi:MAG: tRNA (adenosine(37)-N6)-threonylcarbamoyltransferase complex dimerization subunit type 1 TsaB [Crocinitomicaceae bacterium]|nr:tRNA (adenosine(37)-N6)-threonylcarbamoyltransferase complex dimerization subunit type 1 TsaB [Crocinitomicaceae bacterium]